ncbi:MAG TPA: DUF4089 domain-containing protein [Geminicoccus sp.]|jgi:hypothetical protein|uniref:DUF4089 domain-containing protein n=1 Tax=Geminicoccus sp. TaxID=2024832 RepID=UPI002E37C5BB|nr:DUF4089 domain-containing protein [Geminicoccus sp.]HEX2526704.1 DUF4089 domain-containing protein [Geminicoccus sp.]
MPAQPSDEELAQMIQAQAACQGLTILPEWQPEVQRQLKVAFAMAALLDQQDLPDEAEPLPVFTP